jgi:putative NIF3 family GTP cyclohydrolase 1 type 2
MTAREINEFFLNQADWVDPATTVDKVIVGNPDKEVATVMVTWMPSLYAVEQAIAGGFDMIMPHEPTFYNHSHELEHLAEAPEGSVDREAGLRKKALLEEHDLVVVRNHDVWDIFPEQGIPWAWGAFLGLTQGPRDFGQNRYLHTYDLEPQTLDELAASVAARTATLGEPAVQVVGEGSRTVHKVSIGTGCGCSPRVALGLGCDVAIVTDDGTSYWRDIQAVVDAGLSIIRVHHGTSEEPGMRTLTDYLNENLPLQATLLPHGSSFRLVGEVSR